VISTEDTFARALDAELELVESAVRLVASGAATRVVVSNLAYGRVVVEPARLLAHEAGVTLTVQATTDPSRVQVVATA
jgi:hypothetical protein